MSLRRFFFLLAIWSALCLAALLVGWSAPFVFSAAAAFPFEQIAAALRALSLSGPSGNVAALCLYGFIGLLPLLFLILVRRRRSFWPQDILLLLLCPALLAVLYLMINPGLTRFSSGVSVMNAILGGSLYSILIGYTLLCFLRAAKSAQIPKITRLLSLLLTAVAMVFAAAVFYEIPQSLYSSIKALCAANSEASSARALTAAIIALRHIVAALPYVWGLWAIPPALSLTRAEPLGKEASAAADRLAQRCSLALTVTVCAGVASNLIQLALLNRLLDVHTSFYIPLLPAAFALFVLLLARTLRAGAELKDENELFI